MEAARAGRLDIVALADHDTIAGVREAQAAAVGLVHVIPAIELSTHSETGELHILGYYVDPLDATLIDFSARASRRREERMREMIDRLAGLGIHVAYDDVLAVTGRRPESIGRPHLARALVQRGFARTIPEAFDLYIGDNGPAFVPTRLVTPVQAIELIHAVGGVAVWAHPRLDVLTTALPRMVEWGLDGVECHRPRSSADDVRFCVTAAASFRLLVTGGSDWHGDWHGPLGDFAVQREDVAAFLDAGGI